MGVSVEGVVVGSGARVVGVVVGGVVEGIAVTVTGAGFVMFEVSTKMTSLSAPAPTSASPTKEPPVKSSVQL